MLHFLSLGSHNTTTVAELLISREDEIHLCSLHAKLIGGYSLKSFRYMLPSPLVVCRKVLIPQYTRLLRGRGARKTRGSTSRGKRKKLSADDKLKILYGMVSVRLCKVFCCG